MVITYLTYHYYHTISQPSMIRLNIIIRCGFSCTTGQFSVLPRTVCYDVKNNTIYLNIVKTRVVPNKCNMMPKYRQIWSSNDHFKMFIVVLLV